MVKQYNSMPIKHVFSNVHSDLFQSLIKWLLKNLYYELFLLSYPDSTQVGVANIKTSYGPRNPHQTHSNFERNEKVQQSLPNLSICRRRKVLKIYESTKHFMSRHEILIISYTSQFCFTQPFLSIFNVIFRNIIKF